MDENQVLVILADPGFKEALEVIKPNSEEQKRQRGFDMNRLTSDS